jgi:predicted PurR-regulated permease PerM
MDDDAASEERARRAWWIAAAALAIAVGYVVSSFLGTFVLGLFVYYATRPIYRRLVTRVRQPTVAALTALLGLALPALLLLGYLLVLAARELRALEFADVAGMSGLLDPYVDTTALFDPERLLTAMQADPTGALAVGGADSLGTVLASALAVLGLVANGLLGLTIVLVVAFYLLRDGPRLAGWARSELHAEAGATVAYARAVDRDLETVYFGNILTAVVVALVAAVVYNLLDLVAPVGASIPAPTLLGLLTGIASLVPVVGMKLVYVPMTLVLAGEALLRGSGSVLFAGAFLAASFVAVDSIPEFLLRPYVSGRGLHTGLVMLAYVVGPVLFGWYGLFLGPLLLVAVVHFVRLVLPRLLRGDSLAEPATAPDPFGGRETDDFAVGSVTPTAAGSDPDPDPAADDALFDRIVRLGPSVPTGAAGSGRDAGESTDGDASDSAIDASDASTATEEPDETDGNAGSGTATDAADGR